jgi:AraC family transcriptional regulator of adaptative response/methylated-DNA-[protein]-cysteine methyltransferase
MRRMPQHGASYIEENDMHQPIVTPTTPAYASDDARWDAVRARDAGADGVFYYSVRSTGVYCRPSCASRPARRANVAFHPDCGAAEAAGFRPCLRCRPDLPPLAVRQADAVAEACRLIDAAQARAETPPDLDTLAQACGMSRFHFHRVFRAQLGITPKAYAAARRAERLQRGLAQSSSVLDAAFDAGFQSGGRFYAAAQGALGMRPARYRGGGAGETIRYALARAALGMVLAATTERGLCAILLGDDEQALISDLHARFPQADVQRAGAEFADVLAQVAAFVDAPGANVALPLDVRGTAFQQRVWEALRTIPPGATVSYAALAAQLGMPRGARAVAAACAANPVAIAIPCHRVLRGDGALAGYRWGIGRKRLLLERERAADPDGAAGA